MAHLSPPNFDSIPLYTDGVGLGWVGYGIYMDWPSASFQVFDWKDEGNWAGGYQYRWDYRAIDSTKV